MTKKRRIIIKKTFFMIVIVLLGYVFVNLAGYIYQTRPQLEEHSWQGYISWGDNLAYYGDYELAVKAVETAISKEPQKPEGYAFLADIYLRNRDVESAKTVYADAIMNIGENDVFDEGMDEIANIDLDIDYAKNEQVTETSEDTPKYDTTRKYNSDGNLVYTYARSRDWKRPDVETFFEYNTENQLLKVTELSSYGLPLYTTYEYYDNGQVNIERQCDFDGYVLNKITFDEAGVKVHNEVHNADKSYYAEFINADEYVYRKEFYNTDKKLDYYATYEMTEKEDCDEITTYFNPDGTLKYTIIHKYSSKIKTVQRETYLNADNSVEYIIDHTKDNIYHVYKGEISEAAEVMNSKFYTDVEAYVFQQLEILK